MAAGSVFRERWAPITKISLVLLLTTTMVLLVWLHVTGINGPFYWKWHWRRLARQRWSCRWRWRQSLSFSDSGSTPRGASCRPRSCCWRSRHSCFSSLPRSRLPACASRAPDSKSAGIELLHRRINCLPQSSLAAPASDGVSAVSPPDGHSHALEAPRAAFVSSADPSRRRSRKLRPSRSRSRLLSLPRWRCRCAGG